MQMVEKTWKENGSKELLTIEEAVHMLEGLSYYREGTAQRALQEGAILQTPWAYYHLVEQSE